MAPFLDSIEINRTPEDVFAYFDDLGKHAEWQQQIVGVHVETDGPTRVGSRATDKRRLPGGTRDITYEITEHDPPRTSSFLTLVFELKGQGLGVLFAPLARANARKEIPKSHQRLKEILERER
jgi:hypothetical protein